MKQMMKIIKVKKCGDPDCQFFKRIESGDDNLLGLCLEDKRYITELDQSVHTGDFWFDSEIKFVAGKFPDWCPLEDYEINTTSIQ